jgi:hypothetical protein
MDSFGVRCNMGNIKVVMALKGQGEQTSIYRTMMDGQL